MPLGESPLREFSPMKIEKQLKGHLTSSVPRISAQRSAGEGVSF